MSLTAAALKIILHIILRLPVDAQFKTYDAEIMQECLQPYFHNVPDHKLADGLILGNGLRQKWDIICHTESSRSPKQYSMSKGTMSTSPWSSLCSAHTWRALCRACCARGSCAWMSSWEMTQNLWNHFEMYYNSHCNVICLQLIIINAYHQILSIWTCRVKVTLDLAWATLDLSPMWRTGGPDMPHRKLP